MSTGVSLREIAAHLDSLLRIADVPDYPPALNGVQVEHRGPVRRVASAVDCSSRTIAAAAAAGANLLLVHHGLFWGGLRPLTGAYLGRIAALVSHDLAVYSAHLPLDTHADFGNSVLLARELQLNPSGGFGRFESIDCGVRGDDAIATATLVARCRAFAQRHGGGAVASAFAPDRETRRWAIVSGAGVSAETLHEAERGGIDTLITGEGPHWSAVDAPERGLVIIYAGHYATETLGVGAVGAHVGARFGLPHEFIPAPTGL